MAELAPARAAPLIAAMLVGCGGQELANRPAQNLIALPKAEPTPTELAQTLVRQRLDVQPISFEDAHVFTSRGATVVCGRYRLADRPAQRFIAVGEEDVFVEGDWSGDMDQAVRETCRNA